MSRVQSSISSRTALRVPLRQPARPPCRYSASLAWRKLLSTVASAARGDGLMGWSWKARKEECPNLDPAERGHFACPDVELDTHYRFESLIINRRSLRHLLPLLTLRRVWAMNEPDSGRSLPVDLREVWIHLPYLGLGYRAAATPAYPTAAPQCA